MKLEDVMKNLIHLATGEGDAKEQYIIHLPLSENQCKARTFVNVSQAVKEIALERCLGAIQHHRSELSHLTSEYILFI